MWAQSIMDAGLNGRCMLQSVIRKFAGYKNHPHAAASCVMAREESDDYHPGHIYLEIPRKTYFYLFFAIFGVILIKYLGFWLK